MYTLKITSITKEHSIPDALDYLDVRFEIQKDDETILESRQGFPLETSEEAIKEDLNQFLTTYTAEQTAAEDNSKVEEIQKQADETIQNLEGLEINATSDQQTA